MRGDTLRRVQAEMSAEEREVRRQVAVQTRQANAEQRKANEHLLKLDYDDMNHWLTLASEYKIRMPVYNEPCSAKLIRKYLNKAKVPVETWNDHYTSMTYFVKHNPTWTAVATTGLILELKQEIERKHNDTLGH